MNTATVNSDIRALLDEDLDGAISLVMPTVESSREVEQNRIRFKNLVNLAVAELVRRGEKESVAEKKLQSFRDRFGDDRFWQHQSKGLVAYLSDSEPTYHHLLHSPDELVVIGSSLYVTPLAVDASMQRHELVLALTWDDAHLYTYSQRSFQPIEDEQFPVALRDIVLPPDPEDQLQFRTQQSGAGPSDVHFHGQGQGEGTIESDRRLYLSEVGKRLLKALEENSLPVVLVATDEVAGHFFGHTEFLSGDESGKASRIKNQVQVLRLSPAGLTESQLFEKLKDELTTESESMSSQLSERLGTALAQGVATRDISEAIHSAATGRVNELLINPKERVWGTWDEEQMQAQVLGSAPCLDQPCIELVNATIIKTWKSGGTVRAVDDRELGLAPLAAFYRY